MQCKSLALFAIALSWVGCGAGDQPPMTGQRIPAFVGSVGGAAPAHAGTGVTPGLGTAGTGVVSTRPPGTGETPGLVMTAGMKAPATAGVGAPPNPPRGTAGQAAPPAGGAAAPTPAGAMDPVIPEVAGECPTFKNGTITFMGLGGIEVVAGAKASAPSAPMLFYWHGTGSFSGEYATMAAAVQQGIVSEGGIIISFQDTTGGDLLSGTAIFGMGDFKLTDQLLACAVKNYNIDPRRVFATGCSAGGLFSDAMAAQRSSYLAAAASNSGGWVTPMQFQNKHIPALMTIHGAAGVDVVAIDFSQSSATADKAFKAAGGFVINCDHGGSHCGGGGLAPDIWKFFKAHPFGVSPEPWTSLPAGFNAACKIYM